MFDTSSAPIDLLTRKEIIFIRNIKEASGNIIRALEIEKEKHPEKIFEIEFLRKRIPAF